MRQQHRNGWVVAILTDIQADNKDWDSHSSAYNQTSWVISVLANAVPSVIIKDLNLKDKNKNLRLEDKDNDKELIVKD